MTTDPGGRLFIMSAPSGAGKTTLRNALLKKYPQIAYSVSHTTRAPREGEIPGRDYHFIDRDEFLQGIEEDRWVEWARVHDNYYGTSARFIQRCLDAGCFILLDIDVQGAEIILNKFADAVTIFIQPPSMEVLEKRLFKRGADSPEVIRKRLVNAKAELEKSGSYMHVIINDVLDEAANELIRLVEEYGTPPPCPEA